MTGTPTTTARAVRERILGAIRDGLIDTIIPALSTADAVTVSHLSLRLIDHLLALEAEGEASVADLAARELEVVGMAGGGDAAARLRAVAEEEEARLVARDPEAAGGVAQMYLGGRTSRADKRAPVEEAPVLSPERLTAYLRRRFPDRAGLVVHALDLLPGGMSKQTIKVRAEENGRDASFVIRKDFPIMATDISTAHEFPMLADMWRAGGIPMAEPFWEETDPTVFGTALMAVSLAEGSNDYAAAVADPAQGHVFAEALAKAMARLHAMPLQRTTAGPLVERSAKEHVAAEITRWHEGLRKWKVSPDPVLEGVFAWLHASIPEPVAPAALVHGDIGFHNMLMKDGNLTALLDWEFSHVGDPAEDVVYSRFFVEQVVPWPDFVGYYVKHGGVAPTAEQERFYAVWQSARNAAGCAGAGRAFIDNRGADMKLGVSGMTFGPRFALDALQKIAAGPA